MSGELNWTHAIADIPAKGLTHERVATSDERQLIAGAFDLLACASLTTTYTILPSAMGCYTLSGALQAELQQPCVVTLEPVVSLLKEPFEVVFWPNDQMPAPASGELDLSEAPEVAAIIEERMDIGRVVLSLLAETLDPFPRAPGATLDNPAATPLPSPANETTNPFAVLAQMKTRS